MLGLETLYTNPLRGVRLSPGEGRGDGCGRTQPQSRGQEAEGISTCGEARVFVLEKYLHQGQCWVQLLNPGLVPPKEAHRPQPGPTGTRSLLTHIPSRPMTARSCATHLAPAVSVGSHPPTNTEWNIISILQMRKLRLRAVKSCCLRVT